MHDDRDRVVSHQAPEFADVDLKRIDRDSTIARGKLQQAEQELGQRLLSEMTPKVQAVLRDLIESEGIGLLLQRSAVIHADNGYSITAKVTDKLNQQAAAE